MSQVTYDQKDNTITTQRSVKTVDAQVKRITGDYYYITPRFVVQMPEER